ncbi:hypothetical protein DCM91_11570 [Chitinophaga costaii]|nr:TonB-dependent receptor [Chitinophaga costaii]PUZ24531.1 hypothetical protein DCM91_11570 [Chitinophaga costaii]
MILLTCWSNKALCQQAITGIVTEAATGKPIAGTSIVCSVAHSTQILNFGITDAQGRFHFTVHAPNTDSLVLKFSHVGFTTELLSLFHKANPIIIKLVNKDQVLPEITIHDINKGILKRKDTVDYAADSFATKNDRVLADIIKKLPGMEMKGNQIYYQGNPLQKFYVNGLDLMGGRYGLITNNLPLENVKKVQIVENDQPTKILDSLVPSDKASLNVVLKKHTTTGSGNIGVGASPALWDVSLTPMSFYKHFQMVNTIQVNNTGNDVSDQLKDQINEKAGEAYAADRYVSVMDAGHPPVDQSTWLQNNVKMASTNILYKTQNNLQLRGSLTYIHDAQDNKSYNSTTMMLPAQTVTITEAVKNIYHLNNLTGGLSLEKNEKNIFLKDQLIVDAKWNKNEGWDTRNDTTDISQVNKEQVTSLSNDFKLTLKVGKQLMGINSSTFYKRTPENLVISPGQFTKILNTGIDYQQAFQQVNFHYFTTDNFLHFIKKLHLLTIDFKGGFLFENRLLKSALATDVNPNLSKIFQNNDAFIHTKFYLSPGFRVEKRNWLFELSTPLNWQTFSNQYNHIKSDSTTTRKLTLDPTFTIRFKPTLRWNFYGSVSYKNDFGSQGNLYKGYILQSFQSMNRSLAGVVSQGNTMAYSFYSTYEDIRKAWFSNLSVSYIRSYNNFINETSIDSLGLTVNEMLPIGNNRNVFTSTMGVSKLITGIQSIVKVKGRFNTSLSDQYLNDSFASLHATSAGLSLDVINSSLAWFDFAYKFDYNYSISSYPGMDLHAVTSMNHSLKMNFYPLKGQSLTSKLDYFTSRPAVQSNKLLVNLKYMVTLPKTKTDLSLTVVNVLNARQYINQYNYQYIRYYNELYLRPRQVVASVRFNF